MSTSCPTPIPANQIFKDHSTAGGVVVHLNKLFGEHDPLPINVSLSYNKSNNFQVTDTRRDIYGNPIANPTGTTKDYGVLLSTKDGKYSFRAVKYETSLVGANTQLELQRHLHHDSGRHELAQHQDLLHVGLCLVHGRPDGYPPSKTNRNEVEDIRRIDVLLSVRSLSSWGAGRRRLGCRTRVARQILCAGRLEGVRNPSRCRGSPGPPGRSALRALRRFRRAGPVRQSRDLVDRGSGLQRGLAEVIGMCPQVRSATSELSWGARRSRPARQRS